MTLPSWVPSGIRTDWNGITETLDGVGHAAGHNKVAQLALDMAALLGEAPQGSYASLTERLNAIAVGGPNAASKIGFVYVTNHDTPDSFGTGDYVAAPGGWAATMEAAQKDGSVVVAPSGPAGYTTDTPWRPLGRRKYLFPWWQGTVSPTSAFPKGRYLAEFEDVSDATAYARRPVDQTVLQGFVGAMAYNDPNLCAGGVLHAVQFLESSAYPHNGPFGYPDAAPLFRDCFIRSAGRESFVGRSYDRSNARTFDLWIGGSDGSIAAGPVTGGSVKIRLHKNGYELVTAALPYNATAANVKTALEALPGIGAGNVTVSGGPLPTAAVRFTFNPALFTSWSQVVFVDLVSAAVTLTGSGSWRCLAPVGLPYPSYWGGDTQGILLDNFRTWLSATGFPAILFNNPDSAMLNPDIGKAGADHTITAVDTVNSVIEFDRSDIGYGLVEGDMRPGFQVFSYTTGEFYRIAKLYTTSTKLGLQLDNVTGLAAAQKATIVTPGVMVMGDNASVVGRKIWNVRGPGVYLWSGRSHNIANLQVLDCSGDGIVTTGSVDSPIITGTTVRNAGRAPSGLIQQPGRAAYRIGSVGTNLTGQAADDIGATDYMLYIEPGGEVNGILTGVLSTAGAVDLGQNGSVKGKVTINGVDWVNGAKVGGTPDTVAPSVPTGLASSGITLSSFTVSWTASTDPDPSDGMSGYYVYVNGTKSPKVTGTSYTASGLTAATAYTVAVSAIDLAGNESAKCTAITVTTSAGTPTDVTAPTVPGTPTVTSKTSTTVTLTWTASTDAGTGVASYIVYNAATGDDVATSATNSATVSGLSPSTAYQFKVSAKDGAGNESAQSGAVSVTTNAAAAAANAVSLTPSQVQHRGRLGGSTGAIASEASGAVASRKAAGQFLIINDSGGPNAYWRVKPYTSAVSTSTLVADADMKKVTLTGTSNADWEEMAYGPHPDGTTGNVIWSWEMGTLSPAYVKRLYLFAEPDPATGSLTPDTYWVEFVDTSGNAVGYTPYFEAAFTDENGICWLISKASASTQSIFKLDLKAEIAAGRSGASNTAGVRVRCYQTGKTLKSTWASGNLFPLFADLHPTVFNVSGTKYQVVAMGFKSTSGSTACELRFYWKTTSAHADWAAALSVAEPTSFGAVAGSSVQKYNVLSQVSGLPTDATNLESGCWDLSSNGLWTFTDPYTSGTGNPPALYWPFSFATV